MWISFIRGLSNPRIPRPWITRATISALFTVISIVIKTYEICKNAKFLLFKILACLMFYGCCKNAQISIISFIFQMQVVQEYERVVIFRLGRLLSGGARGPGIFFIVPCVDSYQKVDMRTLTFDVPPQEVKLHFACVYQGSITSTFVPYFYSF